MTRAKTNPEKVLLSDGLYFEFWEDKTAWKKVYHVAQNSPAASDDNPGTDTKPFRTIGKAAEVLMPGEKVIVHEGVYRECVMPARGGDAEDNMICYEAAAGESVIIRGSEKVEGAWKKSDRYIFWKLEKESIPDNPPDFWEIALPREWFVGFNPFSMPNFSQHFIMEIGERMKFIKDHDIDALLRKRGMLFANGRRLKQKKNYNGLLDEPGTFWVETIGLTLHVRPFDDKRPDKFEWEATTREQIFAPEITGLNFIRVCGFTMEHAGNGFSMPQRGALSATGGHRWIIENNTIRQINSIGMDIGDQDWYLKRYHTPRKQHTLGKTIVRKNIVQDCGINGIVGAGMPYMSLIEDNLVERIGYHDVENLFEVAGIKCHLSENCLYRRNLIKDLENTSGIWLDAFIHNSRVTQNTILNCKTQFGGIWVELSRDEKNMIDNNVLINIEGNALYEHSTDRLQICNNLVYNATTAVKLVVGQPQRYAQDGETHGKTRRGDTGREHVIANNVIVKAKDAIVLSNAFNKSENNVFSQIENFGAFQILRDEAYLDIKAWAEFYGFDTKSVETNIAVSFNEEKMQLSVEPEGEILKSDDVAGMDFDFYGNSRDGNNDIAGPFASGLNGAYCIDPRII